MRLLKAIAEIAIGYIIPCFHKLPIKSIYHLRGMVTKKDYF